MIVTVLLVAGVTFVPATVKLYVPSISVVVVAAPLTVTAFVTFREPVSLVYWLLNVASTVAPFVTVAFTVVVLVVASV